VFIILLVITFVISLCMAVLVVAVFSKSLNAIMRRIISDEISQAWVKYLKFAICVVGVSSGVRLWQLEKYISPTSKDAQVLALTRDRWVLEMYGTVINSLTGMAWFLLIFFVFALIAFVIVRVFELKKQSA
jgi:ABC-type transport system involved in multi-copper enzyme maturation permease subunit